MFLAHEPFVCLNFMGNLFGVFNEIVLIVRQVVPSQYWVLVLLYLGFLGTVLFVNILGIVLKWLLWILRKN